MSSLSFLSKKSWHTGLQSNQEAVWKAEKAALEERKKLDELRKERERERELEELERLNVESGGKKTKRQERVDWMYQVPASVASSSSNEPNKEELEEYLLGKKRVDKLLSKSDETETQNSRQPGGLGGVSRSVASSSKTTLGGGGDANSDRDLASKIREDPMFAIRQQEQAAYQALLKDPVRLRAMRKAAGMDVDKGESKEERRRRKDERRRRREEEEYDRNHHSRSRQSGESRSYKRDEEDGYRSRRKDEDSYSYRNDERSRRRDDDEYDKRATRSSRDSRRDDHRSYRDEREYNNSSSRRSRSPRRLERRNEKVRSPSPPRRSSYRNQGNSSSTDKEEERQRKLEAMQRNAEDLSTSRTAYLAKMKEKEDADLALEESLRAKVQQSRAGKGKSGGFGKETKGSFLLEQERSLYGAGKAGESVDLADRLRRGRDTLQRFEAD